MNIDSLFGDEKIDIKCDGCNKDFKVKFKEISKDNSIIKCPYCNVDIRITHNDTTKKTLHDGNKALKDLEKTLKKFK